MNDMAKVKEGSKSPKRGRPRQKPTKAGFTFTKREYGGGGKVK